MCLLAQRPLHRVQAHWRSCIYSSRRGGRSGGGEFKEPSTVAEPAFWKGWRVQKPRFGKLGSPELVFKECFKDFSKKKLKAIKTIIEKKGNYPRNILFMFCLVNPSTVFLAPNPGGILDPPNGGARSGSTKRWILRNW